MKRIFLLTAMILVFTLPEVLCAGFTYELVVETTFTDPYPVEPGRNLVLSLSLFNNGSADVKNVIIELEPREPFTLLESSKKGIGTIGIRKTRIVDYDLYVDSSAVSAIYEIPFRVTYGVDNGFVRTVQVRVQGQPQFELLDVSSGTLSPGDQGEIVVKLQNVGTGKVRRKFVFEQYKELIDAMYAEKTELPVKGQVRYRDGHVGTIETTVKIVTV